MEGEHNMRGRVAPTTTRVCTRRGCGNPVNKPTGKYCSVTCCATDPERHERLRVQARRGCRRTVLPFARQLRFDIAPSLVNPEAELDLIAAGRDEAPSGLLRRTG